MPRMPSLSRKPLDLQQQKNVYYTESESQNSQLNRLSIEDQNCFLPPCNSHPRRLARSFKIWKNLEKHQITSTSKIKHRKRTKRQTVTNGNYFPHLHVFLFTSLHIVRKWKWMTKQLSQFQFHLPGLLGSRNFARNSLKLSKVSKLFWLFKQNFCLFPKIQLS